MSYDIYLEIVTGSGHMHEIYDWNYTSNVSMMWRTAGANLAEFDGKRAGDCAPILLRAIGELRGNPIRYIKMNPPNGWGSYDNLLPRLEELASQMTIHPNATVRVSR
jgi:hypothetical protein